MKRKLLAILPWALAVLVGASAARAQGSITDGAATFRRTGTPFDETPSADLVGVGAPPTQDHLFEAGWWFRVAGDPAESTFEAPTTQTYAGNTSTLAWSDVRGRGLFSAREIAVVKDTAGPSGFVTQTMSITNLSAVAPLAIEVFHMADFDVQGPVNDSGALLFRQNHVRIADLSGNVGEYRAPGAEAHLVRPFGPGSVGAELADAGLDDFDNTGLPFGPGDITAGFQWGATLPPGGSRSFTVVLAVNLSMVRGDFNDDARTDLLIRHITFTRHVVWAMEGLTRTAGAFVVPDVADTNQHVECTDDFSGDQRADLVFRDVTTGGVEFWAMGGPNGTDRQAVVKLEGTPPLPPDWAIAACGDVNRDGKSDIFWRNTVTQGLLVWLMKDNTWLADLVPTPASAVDANWAVAALLDFNGDGALDVHWFNATSGHNVHWFMDPDFVRLYGQFTTPASAGDGNWKVVAAGEYGQGKLGLPPTGAGDIVFRNDDSGRMVGWIMDGQGTFPGGNTRLEGLFTCPISVGGNCDFAQPGPPTGTFWFVIGPR